MRPHLSVESRVPIRDVVVRFEVTTSSDGRNWIAEENFRFFEPLNATSRRERDIRFLATKG